MDRLKFFLMKNFSGQSPTRRTREIFLKKNKNLGIDRAKIFFSKNSSRSLPLLTREKILKKLKISVCTDQKIFC